MALGFQNLRAKHTQFDSKYAHTSDWKIYSVSLPLIEHIELVITIKAKEGRGNFEKFKYEIEIESKY